jgi:small subunit ribosomal protein S7
MSRRTRAEKREISPDYKYGDILVQRFINSLMLDGKKSVAEQILYSAIEIAEKRVKKPGISVFRSAINNVKPVMEVRPRRLGGATYQVPIEVRQDRRISLAIRWIILEARKKSGKSMAERLADELVLASNRGGAAYKKKEETHRMAEANKAFARFKW